MSKKILFFGNERLATGVTTTAPALRALIDDGYDIPAVVVSQSDIGNSRRARQLEIAEVARQHDIPVIAPANLAAAKDELAAYGAKAAVLIAYGQIVPPEVLALFPAGIVNIHPSLLPKHRGSTPIESAILNDDLNTGVSLMRLTETMDAGPLYAQDGVRLPDGVSKQDAADQLLERGVELLMEYLPRAVGASPTLTSQDDTQATADRLIRKADGVIDWQKDAEQLEREVRAYAGWPRSRASLAQKEVVLTKVRLAHETGGAPGTIKTDKKRLVVFCKQGALEIEELIPAGKKAMSGQAFLAGYHPL